MCCFSRYVPFVGDTKIFARHLEDARQTLVYSMSVELPEELAMVLPLPVPPRSPEDAVAFIDLSNDRRMFDELGEAFPTMMSFAAPQAFARGTPLSVPKLVVHDVGDFVASFVPTHADFARLDPRFQMPKEFWSALPQYADWGFAVFKLKPSALGAKRVQPHPIAFSFPRRDPRALFFPTVHVHDGHVAEWAAFDHALYAQPSPLVRALLGWQRSHGVLGSFVKSPNASKVIALDDLGFRAQYQGMLANEDTWLREPEGITLADLEGRGDAWAYRLQGSYAFTPKLPESADPKVRAWSETARVCLPKVARALREGLAAFAQSRGRELRLGAIDATMKPHFMNGAQLWTGTSYLDGQPAPKGGGRGYVQFTPFTDKVEMQTVHVGFEELPSQEGAEEISRALRQMLDRAFD